MAAPYGLNERIALHSVVLALMTVAVGMRLYTRAIITKKFGLDDRECSGEGLKNEAKYVMLTDI